LLLLLLWLLIHHWSRRWHAVLRLISVWSGFVSVDKAFSNVCGIWVALEQDGLLDEVFA